MKATFTEEQKEKARSASLVSLLLSQGEKLKKAGAEYEWMDGAQKVSIRDNLWFHQYDRVGGDAIDFVMRFYGKSFPEAVEFLTGESPASLPVLPQPETGGPAAEKHRAFALPERNGDTRRVFAYLMKRGISHDILKVFADRGMIYESLPYHNAVFVGFDREGTPRHAHKRGTGSGSTFKRNAAGSRPEYSFHWNGTNDRLYLFEAPIDMLSYITMHPEGWKLSSYAAACSVSDKVLFQMLGDDPSIRKVFICFDNDAPGQEAAARVKDKLSAAGIGAEILVPTLKDWNEDLLDRAHGSEH